jgi:UDP-N-acetylmuramate dehydrogenase
MNDYIDIAPYTTFQLPSKVQSVVRFSGSENIGELIEKLGGDKVFVLGGGSNIILPEDMKDRTILKIENKGIEILKDKKEVVLRIAAGEIWDDVVLFTVKNGYSGLEAMSAIPGTVGATPVQNVGAYGEEIKDVLVSLEAYDRQEKKYVTILNSECDFSYRMSRFKKDWKNRFIITYITVELSKGKPKIPEYKVVTDYFKNKNIESPTLMDIREAIIEIRWSKLPRPEEIPNCGSFFENPIVEKSFGAKLQAEFKDLPLYTVDENFVKIPAGWLIEHSGLKGVAFGPVGTYDKNALVLINHGGATQANVIKARDEIIKIVYKKFGIMLESEPEIIK